jgi:hypothetical protein
MVVARVTVTEPVVREKETDGVEADDELWARATAARRRGGKTKRRIAGEMARRRGWLNEEEHG